MRTSMVSAAAVLIVGFQLSSVAPLVFAQSYPSKPVRVVLPFPAGGGADIIVRLLTRKLGEGMNQTFVVDNRAGAAGIIGCELVAKAPADGYTVLLADNAQTTAPALYSQLSYDAVTSFRSIGMIGVAPAILFSGKQSNLRSIKDMAATQGTRPGGFTIGVGAGSPSHLISSLFQMKSKLKLQMVPYKGASQAATDVLGGQIDLIFTNPASAGQHVKSGLMNAIGVSGTQRHPAFPDVATFQEQGVEGMNVSYWFALLMPAGVPDAVAQKWEKELATALASASVSRTLIELGITKLNMSTAQMQRFLTEDKATWANVSKSSGMKLE